MFEVSFDDGPLGLGIELRDKRLFVDQVSLAAQSGIQRGDQIVAVENKPVRVVRSRSSLGVTACYVGWVCVSRVKSHTGTIGDEATRICVSLGRIPPTSEYNLWEERTRECFVIFRFTARLHPGSTGKQRTFSDGRGI